MSPRLSELLLRSQSDERLVSLARAGHDRAFATIVERYRAELLAMALRLVSDGRAEDVLQQALLSAFAALRSGTEVRHVRGWLYQIVRNAAARAPRVDEAPLDEMTAAGPALEDVVQQRALAMSAMSEISRLPERQRDALVGAALGGLGRAELAASMGLSEGAVRQLVHRARVTVRTAVTAVTPWPVANWLASVSGGAGSTSEVVAAASALSGGGIAVKLGALLVTGAVATGVAVVPRSDHHQSRAHVSRAATAPARTSAHVLKSTVVPAAAARVGSGERHHGGGRDDARHGERHSAGGRDDSRRGERGGSGGRDGSDDRGVTTTASSREDRGGGGSSGSSGAGSSSGSGGGSSGGSGGGSSSGSGGGSGTGSSDDGSSHGSSDDGSSLGSNDGSSHSGDGSGH
jgi:RNA polymerase sigma factor (sigma-70 family)